MLGIGPIFGGGVGQDLHQAEFAATAMGRGIEPALAPDDGFDQHGINVVLVRGVEDGAIGFVAPELVHFPTWDRVEHRPVGGIHTYGLENDGIGYAVDEYNKDLISPGTIQTVESARQKIISGQIKVTNAMEK